MIRFKEIRLYPTLFSLDVYVVSGNEDEDSNRERISKIMSARYGERESYYYEELDVINWVNTVKSTDESQLNGSKQIVMILEPKLNVLVHELIHVMHHLADCCHVETESSSTEWNAYFIEHLFTEISDFESLPVI